MYSWTQDIYAEARQYIVSETSLRSRPHQTVMEAVSSEND
jgi:hypothetical protein